jgi:phage terminase small subunit
MWVNNIRMGKKYTHSPKLAPKRERFVAEYLIDLNATQAAIRAGYSEKTAYSQGERLLRNVEIKAAVEVAQEARAASIGRTAEDVLKDIQEVTKSAISKNNIAAALRGLELEGKHLGMFIERQRIEGEQIIEVILPHE